MELERQREYLPADVTAKFGFELLDKHGNVSPTTLKSALHTFTSKAIDWGFYEFFERTKLEQTYINDDCFVLRVSITIGNINASNITRSSTGFPYERLQKFREKNERTVVTFDVDDKHFVAHRLIMAAHSPVFEALLFGSMAESDMEYNIIMKIKEMMPSVFKAMLDFMYNGSLSVDCEVPMLSSIFLHHLLAAADRYAVKNLRVACVSKLVDSISFDTVLSTLELAEMHNCIALKKACLMFIVQSINSVSLMSTEEYIELMHNYPSLLAELKELDQNMRFTANFQINP